MDIIRSSQIGKNFLLRWSGQSNCKGVEKKSTKVNRFSEKDRLLAFPINPLDDPLGNEYLSAKLQLLENRDRTRSERKHWMNSVRSVKYDAIFPLNQSLIRNPQLKWSSVEEMIFHAPRSERLHTPLHPRETEYAMQFYSDIFRKRMKEFALVTSEKDNSKVFVWKNAQGENRKGKEKTRKRSHLLIVAEGVIDAPPEVVLLMVAKNNLRKQWDSAFLDLETVIGDNFHGLTRVVYNTEIINRGGSGDSEEGKAMGENGENADPEIVGEMGMEMGSDEREKRSSQECFFARAVSAELGKFPYVVYNRQWGFPSNAAGVGNCIGNSDCGVTFDLIFPCENSQKTKLILCGAKTCKGILRKSAVESWVRDQSSVQWYASCERACRAQMRSSQNEAHPGDLLKFARTTDIASSDSNDE